MRDVSKTFNRGKPNCFRALCEVNALIESGQITVFTGPSGSGKTTLLALTGCMLRPTTGRIFIDDLEVTSLTQRFASELRRRMFGFVFQEFNLIRGVTALENIMLPAYPTGASHRDLARRAMDLLERLGLASKSAARVETLSGGEKQRVAMARALVNDPEVVIADEPTAHLDAETAIPLHGSYLRAARAGQDRPDRQSRSPGVRIGHPRPRDHAAERPTGERR